MSTLDVEDKILYDLSVCSEWPQEAEKAVKQQLLIILRLQNLVSCILSDNERFMFFRRGYTRIETM